MKKRIIFMGSPQFALPSLKVLLADSAFEVVAVFSQPDRPSGRKMQLQPTAIKAYALEKKIKVFTPEKVNTDEFRELTASLKPDAGVVVAFGQILGQKFLDLFPQGCVNVHASLLPRWRGAAPIQRALSEGDKVSGVCLQTIAKKLDAGDLLGERAFSITETTIAIELHDALSQLGAELISTEFKEYLNGDRIAIPQNEELGVTYAHKIEKLEGYLDFSRSAVTLDRQIRSLAMGPHPFGVWQNCPMHSQSKGKTLKIFARALEKTAASHYKPGEITEVSKDNFSIQCGTGWLLVTEVQPESKSRMSVESYLLGHSVKPGDSFELIPYSPKPIIS